MRGVDGDDDRDDYWFRPCNVSEQPFAPAASADDLLAALRRIEHRQRGLEAARAELKVMINKPPLDRVWRRFTSCGGTSADDLQKFINGTLRPRVIQGRGHLRLISGH
jgi:hypothetical protein